jgi:putative oxidoreductase
MNRDLILRWLRLLCQVSVGFLLLYAGGQKLFVSGVAAFAADVEKFRILPESMIPVAAYLMPWWEVSAGMCLMLDVLRKGALASAIIMTLMFCGVIGWAWSQGLDISCGCFGKSDATIHYPVKSLQLLLQLAALVVAASGPVIAWRDFKTPLKVQELENS